MTAEQNSAVEKFGSVLVDRGTKKSVPSGFKYLESNYISKNIKKQFKAKFLLLSCVCEFKYSSVLKANNGPVLDACDENCLNRQIYIECTNCDWAQYCTNRCFSKGCIFTLMLFDTKDKGCGLKTLDFIKKGSFVIEYVGEVITTEDFQARAKKYDDRGYKHFYTMAINKNFLIDATMKGNASRFINHSCDPNLITELWSVNGFQRMGFFAVKDIEAGTELSFDYNFLRYNSQPQKCYCGAYNCRGFIGKAIMVEESKPTGILIRTEKVDVGFPDTASITCADQIESENASINTTIRESSISESVICPDINKSVSSEAAIVNSTISETEITLTESERDASKKSISSLDEHIKNLKEDNSVFVTEHAIIKFVHLMTRATFKKQRLELLKRIICCTNKERLKEFIIKKGLIIMWSWTFDEICTFDSLNDVDFLNFRLEFLKALKWLPVFTINQVKESKLDSTLELWKTQLNEFKENGDEGITKVKPICDDILQLISELETVWSKLRYIIPKKNKNNLNTKPVEDIKPSNNKAPFLLGSSVSNYKENMEKRWALRNEESLYKKLKSDSSAPIAQKSYNLSDRVSGVMNYSDQNVHSNLKSSFSQNFKNNHVICPGQTIPFNRNFHSDQNHFQNYDDTSNQNCFSNQNFLPNRNHIPGQNSISNQNHHLSTQNYLSNLNRIPNQNHFSNQNYFSTHNHISNQAIHFNPNYFSNQNPQVPVRNHSNVNIVEIENQRPNAIFTSGKACCLVPASNRATCQTQLSKIKDEMKVENNTAMDGGNFCDNRNVLLAASKTTEYVPEMVMNDKYISKNILGTVLSVGTNTDLIIPGNVNNKFTKINVTLMNSEVYKPVDGSESTYIMCCNTQTNTSTEDVTIYKHSSKNINDGNVDKKNGVVFSDKSSTTYLRNLTINMLSSTMSEFKDGVSSENSSHTKSDKDYKEMYEREYQIDGFDESIQFCFDFKQSLVPFIVKLLNRYYITRPDGDTSKCKINSKDEFKFLAKKLTYCVISKELKTKGEYKNLAFTDHFKERVSLFISSYMSRYKT